MVKLRPEHIRVLICSTCWLFALSLTALTRYLKSWDVKPVHPVKLFPALTVNSRDFEPVVTHALFKAGTGNLLFFIASIIGIARTNHRQPVLSKPVSLLKFMKINLPVINSSLLDNFTRIQDPGSVGIYRQKYTNLTAMIGARNAYFAGYLQSYKYFHNYKSEIRRRFQFVHEIEREAACIIKNITDKGSRRILVGVHIRRGDLLKNSGTRGLHRTAPKEYFLDVMENHRSSLGQQIWFIVISDSLDWCKAVFSGFADVRVGRGSSAFVDMCVLQSMDHLILSVGTFGWWSGYLSSARSVTYYRHWYNTDTETGRKFRAKDFFPPDWIAAD